MIIQEGKFYKYKGVNTSFFKRDSVYKFINHNILEHCESWEFINYKGEKESLYGPQFKVEEVFLPSGVQEQNWKNNEEKKELKRNNMERINPFEKGMEYKFIKENTLGFTKGKSYKCMYTTVENVIFKNNNGDETTLCLPYAEFSFEITSVKENRVSHPKHYTWLKDLCGIEVIDITRHLNFNCGNAIKYVLRKDKEDIISLQEKRIEDLKKAVFYLNDEIKRLEDVN